MKIYVCKNCGKTVPLSTITGDGKPCCGDMEASYKKSKFRKYCGAVLWTFFGAVLILGGLGLDFASFLSLAEMRQLERVPATEVVGALPGEINLSGTVIALGSTPLTAPRTGAECVYYKYRKEREDRDSEGKTRWVTVEEKEEHMPFVLRDDTGKIPVYPHAGVEFNVPQSSQIPEGNFRHTEWRIDPGAKVFVFGYAVADEGEMSIRFDRQGHYRPIVSRASEQEERSSMATMSIVMCWLGLTLIAYGWAFLARGVGMHRILTYFSLMALTVFLTLTYFGLKMLKEDLQASIERLEQHDESAKEVIGHELKVAKMLRGKSSSKVAREHAREMLASAK